MIVTRHHMSWLRLMVRFRGTALERIKLRLLFVFVLSSALTAYDWFGGHKLGFSVVPFSLVSVALGVFLGFRNNASYDRYWEGRKLWGQLVNTSRSFARQVLTHLGPDPAIGEVHSFQRESSRTLQGLREELIRRTVGYAHALREHLRVGVNLDNFEPYFSQAEREQIARHSNPPIAMLEIIARELVAARGRGWLDPFQHVMLEHTLERFTDIQGGCERIRRTPVPFSYNVVIHRIVGIYVVVLPIALSELTGLFTPLVTMIVAYAFLGIDAVGDELEDPFGMDPNDLPLNALCITIERDLKSSIGDPIPPPAEPVDEVLT